MAFNITIVAVGKEPDFSNEALLEYRGFDPALVGKSTAGEVCFYKIKSSVPDVQIIHARVLDQHVHSPNRTIVFELPLKDPALTDEQNQLALSNTIGLVLEEILHRDGSVKQEQINGPWDGGNVIVLTLLDVADELNKALSGASSNYIRDMNKP